MTSILLFCVANEAKTFVRKALKFRHDWQDYNTFHLVESRNGPEHGKRFRQVLENNENFDTDFIGASVEDCGKWALGKQSRYPYIEQDLIAIADRRSADDGTLSIQYYSQSPRLEFPPYGYLPKEVNRWYEFRIDYKDVFEVNAKLNATSFDVVFPVYFGHKGQLTDENGIFDVEKANELCCRPELREPTKNADQVEAKM